MSQPDARGTRLRWPAVVAAVLVVGLGAALVAWRQADEQAATEDRAALRRAGDRLVAVADTIDTSLSGAAGLGRADGAVDEAAFVAFARDLTSASDLSVLALEAVVPSESRSAFEQRLGAPITDEPGTGTPAPPRPVHYPVATVEPVTATSGQLLGYDLAGDDVRREAVEAARDSGRTVFSAPVPSQPTGALSLFVVRPIYRLGPVPDTVAERRADVIGFVSTAYAGAGLADALTATLPSGARFSVRDGDEVLATSSPGPTAGVMRPVTAAGRAWLVEVDGATPDRGVAVLLGVVTLLLAAGLALELRRTSHRNHELLRATDRAEHLATLAEQLLAAGTVEEVGRIVTTLGRRPVGAAATSVGIVDGAVLRVEHGDTVPDEYRIGRAAPPLDAPLAFTASARTGATYLFEDHASYVAAFPDAGGPVAGARAFLPLRRADGTVMGAMAHLWERDQPIDDVLRSTLRTVADLTGQALERARLAGLRAEVARQSEELARLAQGLATSRSTDDVTRFLTEGVLAPLGAVHAALGVIDGDQIRRHYTPGARTARVQEVLTDHGPLTAASPLADAARTGEAVLLPGIEEVRARYPELAEGWERLGFAATANLPLRDRRGEPLGALGLAWDAPVDFDQLRSRLATIAGIAGQTLDRARLSDAEHHLVGAMQHDLLVPLPEHAGLRVAARYVPAAHEVGMGGDWYEGVSREDGRYTVVVGDIAGHGITAIAQMAQLRAVVGAMAAFDFPVEEIFPLATALPHRDGPIVASAALVEVDLEAGRLRYACAGHPPPLVRRPDGEVVVLDGGRQPLLGLPMEERPPGTVAFPPGSLLLAYTDGLIERRDRGIDAGIDLLTEVLAALDPSDPDALADGLLARFVGDTDPRDDIAIAVVAAVG